MPQPHEHAALRQAASAKFAGFLAKDKDLTPALRKQYQAAADRVIAGMGPRALAAWSKTAVEAKFYSSAKEVDAKAKELGSKEKKAIPAFTESEVGKATHHLNGGSEQTGNPASVRQAADYYAHEFAHAVDLHGKFSETEAWHKAWKADEEAATTSMPGRAGRGAIEGFADFGVNAWLYPEAAQRQTPECWKAWSHWKLV